MADQAINDPNQDVRQRGRAHEWGEQRARQEVREATGNVWTYQSLSGMLLGVLTFVLLCYLCVNHGNEVNTQRGLKMDSQSVHKFQVRPGEQEVIVSESGHIANFKESEEPNKSVINLNTPRDTVQMELGTSASEQVDSIHILVNFGESLLVDCSADGQCEEFTHGEMKPATSRRDNERNFNFGDTVTIRYGVSPAPNVEILVNGKNIYFKYGATFSQSDSVTVSFETKAEMTVTLTK